MATENVAIGLDEVLKKLGPFGKYTVYNYALILLPSLLSAISMLYNFEAMDINYRCEVPECENVNITIWLEYALPQENDQFSKCKVYQYNNDINNKCTKEAFDAAIIQECDTYVYSDQDSIVKDFNLGCQNWKRTLVGTIHNSGYFIALPLTGFISDKYGRVIAISIASLMNGIFGIARSFSRNYITMLIFEFLEAALGAGHFTCAFVMAMELVRPKERAFAGCLVYSVHVIGVLIITALAWWLQNWRVLLRIIFSFSFVPAFYFLFLNENPRWLITKGRYEEAKDILRNAATVNRVKIPEDMLNSIDQSNEMRESEKISETKDTCRSINAQKRSHSLFWQVIRSKIILVRLVICSFMWMSASFIYYGLSINSVSLAGNKYQNFMLVSTMEIPANVIVFFLINRIGRKLLICITFLLSGCMCITLSQLPKGSIWIIILYLAGKLFGTTAYSSIYIYVSEVFPTNVRQTLMSFCSTMGRFGTTLAPLTPLLAFYYKDLPAIFFGCIAVIASILILILPETLNVTLPDTIEEAEKISKREA